MQLKAIISNRAKEGGVPPQLVMQSYLLGTVARADIPLALA